jgi:mercuric ion transport protein
MSAPSGRHAASPRPAGNPRAGEVAGVDGASRGGGPGLGETAGAGAGQGTDQDIAGNAAEKKLSLGLVAVAVVSSIVASTCCVIPLVLVLMGITGAWMVTLTSLQYLTPVFVVVTLATFGWAGYLVFRPVAACDIGQAETCEKNRRIMRRVYVAGAVFIGLLLSFPLMAPLFY